MLTLAVIVLIVVALLLAAMAATAAHHSATHHAHPGPSDDPPFRSHAEASRNDPRR